MYTGKWRSGIFIFVHARGRRAPSPSTHGEDSTDWQILKGKNSRWRMGGFNAAGRLRGVGTDCTRKVLKSAPRWGHWWRWVNLISRKHKVLAWESKARLWKCHSANGALTALPGSYLEAFEDQPGNRKLFTSIFKRILGWWVLLCLFILLNYGNLPLLRICSDVRY